MWSEVAISPAVGDGFCLNLTCMWLGLRKIDGIKGQQIKIR